ncbi:hypothetical protein I9W82_004436 [Candida metapsilosis]|uniref:Spo11/DNA topoisomerase VI subunit A N-terminal domain-containing protein n=1 Tax=Candida metapsilosis TaxID=273372 RepID=A0A8H7ZA64_9ASCO|nr:hypothetical protein I9W82_004436 [Candida metapsilosis]
MSSTPTIGTLPVGFVPFTLNLKHPVLITPHVSRHREPIDTLMGIYASMHIRVGITDLKLKFPDETLSLYESDTPLDYYLLVGRLLRNLADGRVIGFRELYYMDQDHWSNQQMVSKRVKKISTALNIELDDLNVIPDCMCTVKTTFLRQDLTELAAFDAINIWLQEDGYRLRSSNGVVMLIFEKFGAMMDFLHQYRHTRTEKQYICVSSSGFPSHGLLDKIAEITTRFKVPVIGVTDRDTAGLHIYLQLRSKIPNTIYLDIVPQRTNENTTIKANEKRRASNLMKDEEIPLFIKYVAIDIFNKNRTVGLNQNANLGYVILKKVESTSFPDGLETIEIDYNRLDI